MAPGSLKDCHIVVLKGTKFHSEYTSQNLKKWIESAGGHVSVKEILTDQTTHVVMDEDTWMDQGPFVQQILETEGKETPEPKSRVIHIVSFDWLQDCLDNRVKRRESNFKWKKLAGGVLKDRGGELKHPGNVQGLYKQAFMEYTNDFAVAGEKKRIEKRKRQEAEAQADELEEEKRQFQIHRKKMSVPEQAAVFRKGAKRARTDILSDNHHIYVDDTGFPFDVTVTKVDLKNNANERYVLTLQIYESNREPHSYAFNSSFAGTKVLPRNDIIAAIGSNFATAFRAFKKTFREHTKVEWDDRIVELNKRESKARLNIEEETPFHLQNFEYYPPKYGPIGELPLAQAEVATALVKTAEFEPVFQPSAVVGDWKMSGGNGSRNDSPGFEEFMASSAKGTGLPPDDQLMDSPFDYPFELACGGKYNAIVVDDDAEEDEDVPQAANNEQDNLTRQKGTVAESTAVIDEDKTFSQQEELATQAGTQSYQQPTDTYEFDDDLDLTQSLDFPEMLNGSFQLPSQPLYMARTQAVDQTQLAEAARTGLLSDEQTKGKSVAVDIADLNSAESTIKKTKTEAYETQMQTQGEGGNGDESIDLGLGFI